MEFRCVYLGVKGRYDSESIPRRLSSAAITEAGIGPLRIPFHSRGMEAGDVFFRCSVDMVR